ESPILLVSQNVQKGRAARAPRAFALRWLHPNADRLDRGMARLPKRPRHRLSDAFLVDRARAKRVFARWKPRQQNGPVCFSQSHRPRPWAARAVETQRVSRNRVASELAAPPRRRTKNLRIDPRGRGKILVFRGPLLVAATDPNLNLRQA